MGVSSGNELIELYDSLSILYDSLPANTHPDWSLALKSILYGGDLLDPAATCYGKQQNERNTTTRKEYVRRLGNGNRITEFSAITVREPRPEDRQYVPSGAVLPVAPDSNTVLPVLVTEESIDRAISLLAEFPAEPTADRPSSGATVLLDRDRVREARAHVTPPSTTETTILFVSDTHLGYENRAKTGRGQTVPWIGDISTRGAFKKITEIAMKPSVDAIIHTGDILDHEVDETTLDYVETYLGLLQQHGIPFYCIIGSHDHDSYQPQHPDSVNGIEWLKQQARIGNLTELTTNPTAVAGGPLDAYGISAGNVGINDVGTFQSREWSPVDIHFEPPSRGPNILCLHDKFTPYRRDNAIDLDQLLAQTDIAFECILVGDEHRPRREDFETGYTFETSNGTPVFYTGPAVRISQAYRNRSAFITELTIPADTMTPTRHEL